MKLSNLKTGDILKIEQDIPLVAPIIFLLSDTILLTHNENNKLLYLEIVGYKLLYHGYNRKKPKFSLNEITIQDVLNNKYDLEKASIERFNEKDLPLYIDKPTTIWYDRVLKRTIRGYGSDLSKRLKDIVDDYINQEALCEEAMSMYENGLESG